MFNRRLTLSVRMPVAFLVLAAVLLSPALASGQSLSSPTGANEAEIKAAAEKEGRSFPKSTVPSDSALPRLCVVTYERGPARSGEFTIGGSLSGSRALSAGRQGKIWWAPLYADKNMPPLVVRGRNLTDPRDTLHFTSSNLAWNAAPGAPPIPEDKRRYLFPTGITISTPGRWLVIATSGMNWGCFILTVER